jgi:hypothetical protein
MSLPSQSFGLESVRVGVLYLLTIAFHVIFICKDTSNVLLCFEFWGMVWWFFEYYL